MSITVRCHPFGSGQVTIERTPRAFWFMIRVNVQNDPRNFPPVGVFSVSIKQSQIRHHMAMVIPGQRGGGWRHVGDIWIKRRFVRRHPGIIIPDKSVKTLRHFRFSRGTSYHGSGVFPTMMARMRTTSYPFRDRPHPRTAPCRDDPTLCAATLARRRDQGSKSGGGSPARGLSVVRELHAPNNNAVLDPLGRAAYPANYDTKVYFLSFCSGPRALKIREDALQSGSVAVAAGADQRVAIGPAVDESFAPFTSAP